MQGGSNSTIKGLVEQLKDKGGLSQEMQTALGNIIESVGEETPKDYLAAKDAISAGLEVAKRELATKEAALNEAEANYYIFRRDFALNLFASLLPSISLTGQTPAQRAAANETDSLGEDAFARYREIVNNAKKEFADALSKVEAWEAIEEQARVPLQNKLIEAYNSSKSVQNSHLAFESAIQSAFGIEADNALLSNENIEAFRKQCKEVFAVMKQHEAQFDGLTTENCKDLFKDPTWMEAIKRLFEAAVNCIKQLGGHEAKYTEAGSKKTVGSFTEKLNDSLKQPSTGITT